MVPSLLFFFLIYSHRELKDLRCIVFVERIVTAIVIRSLLNELLPASTGWRTEYTAGNNSRFQSQSRKEQNAIVDEFRKGTVRFELLFFDLSLQFRIFFCISTFTL